ncbi:MAG: RNA polymerase sigma factor [Chthoniobacterales bacterium]
MADTLDQDRGSMARLAAGEDMALNEIMERWKTRLVAFLYRLTGNEASSLELAEETFVRVYQNRTKFRPDANFSSWLFGIAANLGRNHLRWQRRHPTLPLDAADEVTMEGDPGTTAQSRERETAVRSAIAKLPADLKESLILSEYEQLPHAEIAAIAGCSVKAVERRISHARELLRKELSRYFES